MRRVMKNDDRSIGANTASSSGEGSMVRAIDAGDLGCGRSSLEAVCSKLLCNVLAQLSKLLREFSMSFGVR
jgi:hypothetical protein